MLRVSSTYSLLLLLVTVIALVPALQARQSKRQAENAHALVSFARALETQMIDVLGQDFTEMLFGPMDPNLAKMESGVPRRRSSATSKSSVSSSTVSTMATVDCTGGVYANVTLYPTTNGTSSVSFRSVCICPLDYLGSRCTRERPVRCGVSLISPTQACLDAKNMIGLPSCLRYASSDKVIFEYALSCSYAEPERGVRFTAADGYNASNPITVLELGSKAQTTATVGPVYNYSMLRSAFQYPVKVTRQVTSGGTTSLEIVAAFSQALGWQFSWFPMNFDRLTFNAGEKRMDLSVAQLFQNSTVKFEVSFANLDAAYKKYGRIYIEAGFPFNETVSYMPEQYKSWDRIAVDITDYVEPEGQPKSLLIALIVSICVTAVVSFLAIVWVVWVHQSEIRDVIVKRHEFLSRKKTN